MTSATVATPRGWHVDPRLLYTGSRLLVLVLLCVTLAIASPVFFTATNALNAQTGPTLGLRCQGGPSVEAFQR